MYQCMTRHVSITEAPSRHRLDGSGKIELQPNVLQIDDVSKPKQRRLSAWASARVRHEQALLSYLGRRAHDRDVVGA